MGDGHAPMSRKEKALEYFRSGYNCAQAILTAYGPGLGLGAPTCVKLASPFGAGIARLQMTCGAVTGGLMALGLARGEGSETSAGRDPLYERVARFLREFSARHRSLECRDLLGIDLSTPEGRAEIKRKGHDICLDYVESAAEILEGLL
jgi:C_GCAxxG_C_C family probable redox protein